MSCQPVLFQLKLSFDKLLLLSNIDRHLAETNSVIFWLPGLVSAVL